MSNDQEIIQALGRIEENQRKSLEGQQQALETQRQQLEIAQALLDRSNKTIEESISLQRVAVARVAQITRIALPLVVVLVILLGYLVVKWRLI